MAAFCTRLLAYLKKNGIRQTLSAGFARLACKARRKRHELAGHRYVRHPRPKRDRGLRILYVTSRLEASSGQTVRYRVANLRQALHGRADTLFEVMENGVYLDDAMIARASLIVLMRQNWSGMTETLVNKANEYKVPVIFDIDDIIFLPEYAADFCRVIGNTEPATLTLYTGAFENYNYTFRHCRTVTASTFYIADLAAKRQVPSFVIHNGLNRRQIRIAGRIRTPADRGKPLYITYLSGTKTHDRDFAVVLPALEKILNEYENVRLRIFGYIDIRSLPDAVRRKTEHIGYMKWDRLLRRSAESYVNLAPLDRSNPFCQAKSELKYFESAVVGVPTVASATDTFTRCIRHGENGLLAATAADWYTCIKSLLDDRGLHEKIRLQARREALEKYSPQAIAREAMAAYHAILDFSRPC